MLLCYGELSSFKEVGVEFSLLEHSRAQYVQLRCRKQELLKGSDVVFPPLCFGEFVLTFRQLTIRVMPVSFVHFEDK